MKTHIVWLRRELRENHPAFQNIPSTARVVAVYVWEDREKASWLGIQRFGSHKEKFITESLNELQQTLAKQNIELLITSGNTIKSLLAIVERYKAEHIHWSTLPAYEEKRDEHELKQKLQKIPAQTHIYETYTLWSAKQVCERINKPLRSFSQFRKRFEPLLEESFPAEPLQSVTDKYTTTENIQFNGGRSHALNHLSAYLQQNGPVRHYKSTRNGMLGMSYSSKLSPWLAWGNLGPEEALRAVHQHETEFGKNESTHWLKIELLWREFFQHLAVQAGPELFYDGSPQIDYEPIVKGSFAEWVKGETNNDFVNANMKELNATGFMSNRGRQNVASALIYDLGEDWRKGACYFEQQLIDYDPASNYGNWQYIAGLRANSRGGSWFNVNKQAQMYDSDGSYRRHWLSL
ncbi:MULTISPECIES: DASH family cryptochrome [Gammaproteobacteria]|uniref:DASH family cryptochrome n=1 Tax=Gammaproteobacteria TaxID=1236 RepID=UPI000DD0A550|nr:MULTISPECIES: DASH family cryptochrome [Gammaproteobacteria]RTE87738.1 DASH family cryptochrome [Aliidiomarina sp. B3213]TCZ92480.1 DASH family cryptochrome [Lysobacter sp. N42]